MSTRWVQEFDDSIHLLAVFTIYRLRMASTNLSQMGHFCRSIHLAQKMQIKNKKSCSGEMTPDKIFSSVQNLQKILSARNHFFIKKGANWCKNEHCKNRSFFALKGLDRIPGFKVEKIQCFKSLKLVMQ